MAAQKIKKNADVLELAMKKTTDVLATIKRAHPQLFTVGFAAETNDVIANATAKRLRKGSDWIVANDVATGTGTFGGKDNTVTLISDSGAESWPRMGKDEVAKKLAARIAEALR